jgi:oligosaccharide 4-alpha-D-glucosyltransferase
VLPRGTWVDFSTGAPTRGQRTIGASAPLGQIPLLVRGGALIPMAPVGPNTAQASTDTLYVRYYATDAVRYSESKLYEDDGRNARSLPQEQFRRWALRANNTDAELQLTLGKELYSGNGYPGEPARRTVQWWIPRVAAAPASATLNGQPLASSAWQYDAATHTLRINTPQQRGQNVELALRGLRLLPAAAAQPDRTPVAFTLGAVSDRSTSSGTEVQYQVHTPGVYAVQVRDASGRVVRTLASDAASPGERRLRWDTRNDKQQPVPAGVYYFEAQGQRQRIVVMR